jgi:hypothetical protein
MSVTRHTGLSLAPTPLFPLQMIFPWTTPYRSPACSQKSEKNLTNHRMLTSLCSDFRVVASLFVKFNFQFKMAQLKVRDLSDIRKMNVQYLRSRSKRVFVPVAGTGYAAQVGTFRGQ